MEYSIRTVSEKYPLLVDLKTLKRSIKDEGRSGKEVMENEIFTTMIGFCCLGEK